MSLSVNDGCCQEDVERIPNKIENDIGRKRLSLVSMESPDGTQGKEIRELGTRNRYSRGQNSQTYIQKATVGTSIKERNESN